MTETSDETGLLSPATLECPYTFYAQLRRERPVYRMPETGFFVLTLYDDIRHVARHPEIFSSELDLQAQRPEGPNAEVERVYREEGWEPAETVFLVDPPTHTRNRAIVDRAFSARRVRQMTSAIEAIVTDCVDAIADRGQIEFVGEFAMRVPLRVIADQIGVPGEDIEQLRAWTDTIVESGSLVGSPQREVECARTIVEFQHYLAGRIEERRRNPSDDFLNDLVQARDAGEPAFSTRELVWLVAQLLSAGNQTTTDALAAGMLLLIDHVEMVDLLRADARSVEAFVEETLRCESPVQGTFRLVRQDTEIGDTPIPEGSVVILRLAAANRDEARFDDSETFDIRRPNAHRHLAFGAGIHFCAGAALAREELRCTFRQLVRRLDGFRLAPGHPPPEHHPNFLMRGLRELHLEFDKLV